MQRGQLRGRYEMPPGSEISPDWSIIAIRNNNIVTWHSLQTDARSYANEPLAITTAAINIRETPSTELARIGTVAASQPLFAIARTEDNFWIQLVLPDGTLGWTFISSALRMQQPIESLPVFVPEEVPNPSE